MSFTRVFSRRSVYLFGAVAAGAATATAFNTNNCFNGNNNNNNFGNFNYKKAGFFGFGSGSAGANLVKIDKTKTQEEYQKIYNDIAEKIRHEDEFDNYIGYGPILVRIAWHSSGTYDNTTKLGGSYGGTYRFEKERNDPANAGLQDAAAFLQPIKEKYSWISYGDLYTLAGVTAVQEAHGPKIPWRNGRVDLGEDKTPENGFLPDAATDSNYVRTFFKRLDFTNDEEVVALMGAHCLGKAHLKNSGFEGPWGAASNIFSNEFFVNLLNEQWKLEKNAAGNQQYNSPKGYMMLPADFSLTQDTKFKKIVTKFANDQDAFFKVFTVAFAKLLDNGVVYEKNQKPFYFKTLDEQDL